MHRTVLFRGHIAEVIERRLSEFETDKFYYHLIHSDYDWSIPFSISENRRLVNWFGYSCQSESEESRGSV